MRMSISKPGTAVDGQLPLMVCGLMCWTHFWRMAI